MQRFKVNKGINKKIRFLGMESEFAQQYLIALSSYWLVVFTLFGSTKTFLLFGIIGIFIIYIPFRAKDARNKKNNLKKLKANKLKPTHFKRFNSHYEEIK
ncbi:hypothetical protein ACTS91_17290 [Empedobacter falsenii]|uniref:hypothetical protein n=1 Tax=Weeksellaceae TaxID=2762318 RepID=UPI0025772DCB|nr:hypothetical protein [Empedobacter falsenii]MDM1299763.1 hypothetical protein [Empedobacter falsenii]MDM1319556.1 hypothetical protein [Empedobacter falsenii]